MVVCWLKVCQLTRGHHYTLREPTFYSLRPMDLKEGEDARSLNEIQMLGNTVTVMFQCFV